MYVSMKMSCMVFKEIWFHNKKKKNGKNNKIFKEFDIC